MESPSNSKTSTTKLDYDPKLGPIPAEGSKIFEGKEIYDKIKPIIRFIFDILGLTFDNILLAEIIIYVYTLIYVT